MVNYFKAPLPFLGQKRNFVKLIRKLDFNNHIVVDLFGGSGLLSHTIKQQCPSAAVIYNDFDDYKSRLNSIQTTDKLRLKLLEITSKLKPDSRIADGLKGEMVRVIIDSGVDDFLTLSSWLLFSGNYAHSLDQLVRGGWYSRVTLSTLSADGYLEGVERVQGDFRQLIEQYSDMNNVIFIADPPYTNTNQTGYSTAKTGDSFSSVDTSDLVKLLQTKQAIMFSSAKTNIDDALDLSPPKAIKRVDYRASIGCGKLTDEYMYFVNLPEEFYSGVHF